MGLSGTGTPAPAVVCEVGGRNAVLAPIADQADRFCRGEPKIHQAQTGNAAENVAAQHHPLGENAKAEEVVAVPEQGPGQHQQDQTDLETEQRQDDAQDAPGLGGRVGAG